MTNETAMRINRERENAARITIGRPSEDVLIGLDRALSYFERGIADAKTACEDAGLPFNPDPDVEGCLRAAEGWLASIQRAIYLDDLTGEEDEGTVRR